MSEPDLMIMRGSRWAAKILKHNARLGRRTRPVLLDDLVARAIEQGWLERPSDLAEEAPRTLGSLD